MTAEIVLGIDFQNKPAARAGIAAVKAGLTSYENLEHQRLQAQMMGVIADAICGIPVYGYGEGIDSIVPPDYDPRHKT